MGTDFVEVLGTIAIKTEDLEPFFRESIFAQPCIEATASTNLATVLCAIVLHMINGQHLWSVLTTACTHAPISGQHLLTKVSIPKLHIVFLTTLEAYVLEPIAICTKQLKSFLGKAVLSQPQIETIPTASKTAMLSSVVLNMVNRKKCRVSLSTLAADAAICGKNLLTKLISVLLTISITAIANETTRFGRVSKTLATHTCLSFLHGTLTTMLILASTDLLSLFGRFSAKRFALRLKYLLTVRLIVIMAASFAGDAKPRLTTTFSAPVLGGSVKPALTSWAILLLLRGWMSGKKNIINRLIAQSIEIKCALNVVLGYNALHGKRSFLIVTPRDACTIAGAPTCCLPQV
jgi:hypothetical protein